MPKQAIALALFCAAACGKEDPGAGSCTLTDSGDGTYTITCGETSMSVREAAGGAGEEYCTVTGNPDGSSTIVCGDLAIIVSGDEGDADGSECSLVRRPDGAYEIACGPSEGPATDPPRVAFLLPLETHVFGRILVVIEASAPAGLDRVTLSLDDEIVAVFAQAPYSWEWDTSTTGPGARRLSAQATDLEGRSATASLDVVALPPVPIFDPYRAVDWGSFGQYRANFHTHTTESDGSLTPAQAIDEYHAMGYSVLALTDHDRNTWNWPAQGRDPAELGMVAVQGSEPSQHHHIGSYFNDYAGASADLLVSLDTIRQRDGLSMMFHPGRYSYETSWYVDLYRTHDHLVGMEVYNQGDRYPGDRAIWDAVLAELMPDRPVWGFSNDDAHTRAHMGCNWQTLLLPSLTEQSVKDAMIHGELYFSYAPVRGNPAPVINSIDVDEGAGTIAIDAVGWTDVHWISGGTVIQSGSPTIMARSLNGYLRVELDGPAGTTYTQPFFVGDPELGRVVRDHNMRVTEDGLAPQSFGRRPSSVSGWSTRTISGGNATHTTLAHLDNSVQNMGLADGGWEEPRASSTWPPSAHGLATWNDDEAHGGKLQTRPTLVAATLLLATLENHTGRTVSSIEVFYDFGSWLLQEVEHVFGHRAFFSLTGEAGTWRSIPSLSPIFSPTTVGGEFPVSDTLRLGAWEPGARLYILWADDNGLGGSTNSGTGREGAYTIDGFGVRDVRFAALE